MKIHAIFQTAIERFGIEHQKTKSIEELSELQTVIARDLIQNEVSLDEIIDEIADAYIMIQQLSIIYGEKDVIERIYTKAERLKDMILNL